MRCSFRYLEMQTATFGAGCFWCTEAIFQTIKGVEAVRSGYMGGEEKHPTIMEIISGNTGHAEVVEIIFDENIISYEELLLTFFKTHNPTRSNYRGNENRSPFRSVIFYHNAAQQRIAREMLTKTQKNFDKPVTTEIRLACDFYQADDYHQNYYQLNPTKPFCTFVIRPKLDKLAADCQTKLKSQ